MKEVIVMPVCNRPEMLSLALRGIDQANNPPDDVRIFCDTDTCVSDVEYVRDTYLPHAQIFQAGLHPFVPSGMWNILNALKQGYETGADLIYHIEEDVVVKPKFFEWHRKHNVPGIMATCGRRWKNYPYYTNPGSCFHRSKLGLVVKHIIPALFSNHVAYQDVVFGKMEESSHLDDGLIRRVARQHNLPVVYPNEPMCSHIGFRYYRKVDIFQNNGTIQERIVGLEDMLSKLDPNGRYSRDYEPI